jgi:hypothetical protein
MFKFFKILLVLSIEERGPLICVHIILSGTCKDKGPKGVVPTTSNDHDFEIQILNGNHD